MDTVRPGGFYREPGKKPAKARGWFSYLIKWVFTPNLRVLKLEKYIFGEVWSWYLLGLLGFTIFMTITSLFLLGEKIFSKKIPVYTTVKILILSAPAYLVLALPFAVLIATLMAMGRLSRDNEITMFVASGVSLYSILIPFLALGLYTAVVSWSVYEYVVPVNNKQFTKVLAVFWDSQVVDYIRPNVVIKAPGEKYFYIEKIDRDKGLMYNLRLYDFAGGRPNPRIFLADQASVKNKFLNLEHVRVIEADESTGNVIASAKAGSTEVDIERRFSIPEYEPAPQELSSKDLRMRIFTARDEIAADKKKFQFPGRDKLDAYNTDYTEYYLKYSIPFASVVFVLVAVPLSLRGPRDERNLGLILAFFLALGYYALYFSFRLLGYLGKFPAFGAGWAPTLIFAVAGVILLVRARR